MKRYDETGEVRINNWLRKYKPEIKLVKYSGSPNEKSLFVDSKGRRWMTTFRDIRSGHSAINLVTNESRNLD